MTSLAAAIAVDSRGPCSLYIITDSRITWLEPTEKWDFGCKTFASYRTPDIFGYCGDAYFVPMIIRQSMTLFDLRILGENDCDAEARHAVILQLLQRSIEKVQTKYISNFSFFHGARDGEYMKSNFRLWQSAYDVNSRAWSHDEIEILNNQSYLIHIDGSGKTSIQEHAAKWVNQPAGGTSRAAIYTFCQALRSKQDPFSGGPPQLVGLFRKGAGQQFGFSWDGVPYVGGIAVPASADFNVTKWFNHLFEICDGRTGSKQKNSKSHRASLAPRVRRKGK